MSNLDSIFRRRQWHPTPVLLPGKSHGWRSLVGCSPWGREESDTSERLYIHFSLSCIGEGNGNPLQCSCLENPRDKGAWWAAVYGVTQSRTWLKRLRRQHIQKQRRYFANKGQSSQGYGFSSGHVWMWELDYEESWALKNWCFWTWTARTSSKSILKEISPEYSLEILMLKLKLQYFSHLMQRTDSLEKTLILGKIEGRRRKGWQRMR